MNIRKYYINIIYTALAITIVFSIGCTSNHTDYLPEKNLSLTESAYAVNITPLHEINTDLEQIQDLIAVKSLQTPLLNNLS